MKRINGLKKPGIFVKTDMNKEEREQDFQLYMTLKKTREQNPENTYKIIRKKSSTNESLKMVLANTRSIKGKMNELQVLSYQYNILCLTETHIDNTFTNNEILQPSNKAIYRNDRNIHGVG